jgi:class 3 adenylate cyclase
MWSAATDVGEWLRDLGLGQYEAHFRDNKIDADMLPRLTGDDLKDIGVSALGDRLRLLDAIAAWARAKPPVDVSSSKSAPPKSPQVSAERRPITVMFCDLVGWTALASLLDPEDWRSLLNAYLDESSGAVNRLGGHVLKRLGDGLLALFGYPRARRARVGPSGGRGGGRSVRRSAQCRRARVQALAEPGVVLVTANVQRQTAGLFVAEDKGAHELKGVPAPTESASEPASTRRSGPSYSPLNDLGFCPGRLRFGRRADFTQTRLAPARFLH